MRKLKKFPSIRIDEDKTNKDIVNFLEILSYNLKICKIDFQNKNKFTVGNDPTYSCYYFYARTNDNSKKKLSIVFDKRNGKIMYGIIQVTENHQQLPINIGKFSDTEEFEALFSSLVKFML